MGVAFPAASPSFDPTVTNKSTWVWNLRIADGPTPFDIGLGAVALVWLIRAKVITAPSTRLDRPLALVALILLLLTAFTFARSEPGLRSFAFDLERLVIPAAAFLIVSRSVRTREDARAFAFIVGLILVLTAGLLVLVYGVMGSTQFGTITGQTALLITEDSLLLIFPAVIAWGYLVDGRLGQVAMVGTVLLLVAVVAVDFQSLRRGALLMIGFALLVRSASLDWSAIRAHRRVITTVAVLLALVGTFLVTLGPAQSLIPRVSYVVESALLQTDDTSSSQRLNEIEDFQRNMGGIEWLTGSGLGVTWSSSSSAEIDAGSFGSGENPFVRIGWHVYGLDWTYKFGALGIIVLLSGLAIVGTIAYRAYNSTIDPDTRSLIFSLFVVSIPLGLMTLTSPRIGLLLGITLALLGRSVSDQRRPRSQ